MEKYLIFLDVDGVLNAWDKELMLSDDHVWFDGEVGAEGRDGLLGMLKSRVNNFKHLYNELSKHFDVDIVVCSSWRINMNEFCRVLKQAGYVHDKEYDITSTRPAFRHLEIINYLDSPRSINKIGNYRTSNRYVIIDDDVHFDETKHDLPKSRLITPNIFKGGLTTELVENFLKQEKEIHQWEK